MEDTLAFQVYQLLSLNGINMDKRELVFQIKSHPSYPSLHAVTGVLDHFNFDNLALDVPVTSEVLEQLPPCFLAQVRRDGHEVFAVVTRMDTDYLVSFSAKERIQLTASQFLEAFTGILVAVEKSKEEESYTPQRKRVQNALYLLTVVGILGWFIWIFPGTLELVFMAVAVIGFLFSYAIIQQEQGVETSLGNAFCSGISEQRNCIAVVQSEGGTLFGKLKLSTSSVVYFSGLLLSGLFLIIGNGEFNALYLLSIIALPITIYSIYYQWVVTKKWCALCLGIVAVLWLTVGISTGATWGSPLFEFQVKDILAVSVGFLAATAFWLWLLPNYELLKRLQQIKIEAFRFKRNFHLFKGLLDKSQPISTEIQDSQELVFGNKHALLSVTVVTNPFCGHCKAVHTLIKDLLKKHNDKVKIIIRFGVNSDISDSNGTIVALRLLELFNTKGANVCLEAMHDIYGGVSIGEWLNKWGTCTKEEHYLNFLKRGTDWTREHQINFTPEILVNGRSYPKEYKRSDLIYFIEELEETCCGSKTTATATSEIV
ncbi:MAG: vitamin K epoxide reductase family protein [Bacteroidota bacterium]